MERHPQVGSDMARKVDLGRAATAQHQIDRTMNRLEATIEASTDRMLAAVRTEFARQTRTCVVALIVSLPTAAGIAVAVARVL